MTGSDSKACTKCGEVKPLDEFYKHAECKGGYRPDCKVCVRAEKKAWRLANLEERRAFDRTRYAERDERRSQQRLAARAHYETNRDAHLAYKKQYYKDNPEVYERGRAKRNAAKRNVEHQPYTRREIYERDGGVCRGCGKRLDYAPGAFQIDHIVPLSLNGPDIPANLQLMCPPCNRRKWATLEGQIHLPV